MTNGTQKTVPYLQPIHIIAIWIYTLSNYCSWIYNLIIVILVEFLDNGALSIVIRRDI